MATFSLNTKAFSSVAVHTAGPRAFGIFTQFGMWCAEYVSPKRTNNHVPRALFRMVGARKPDIDALVKAGLVRRTNDGLLLLGENDIWSFGSWSTQRPRIPDAVRERVYARDGYACVECTATDDLSLDHIWPYSRGGSDSTSNLRTLCRSCNSKKGARV